MNFDEMRAAIEALEGNPWDWRGVNPYAQHPLATLGLADEQTVTVAKIRAAATRIENEQRHGDGAAVNLGAVQKAQALLTEPLTRVICELLRFPPVSLGKAERDRIVQALHADFSRPGELPAAPVLECDLAQAAAVLLDVFADQPGTAAGPDATPSFEGLAALPRTPERAISFNARPLAAPGDENR